MKPGLYDENDVLIISWNDLVSKYKFDVEKDLLVDEISQLIEITDRLSINNQYKLIISEGIKHIGEGALFECQDLIEVILPETLESIGCDAFESCCNLTKIEIPDSVTEIGTFAFEGCSNLKDIKLPLTLNEISESCFQNCNNLKSISLPNTLTHIGKNAFAYTKLTEIEIPENVESINHLMFNDCKFLQVIHFKGNVYSYYDLYEYKSFY